MPLQSTSIKKDVGARFYQFRKEIGKTQTQLSEELGVYQSTIASFEMGKTFPSLKYLNHFHRKYNLNINWLVTGNGDMFVAKGYMDRYRLDVDDLLTGEHGPRWDSSAQERYAELLYLMEIPIIEQVIMAKLLELKILLKDEVWELYQRKMEQQDEQKENGNGDENQG